MQYNMENQFNEKLFIAVISSLSLIVKEDKEAKDFFKILKRIYVNDYTEEELSQIKSLIFATMSGMDGEELSKLYIEHKFNPDLVLESILSKKEVMRLQKLVSTYTLSI